MTITYQKTTVVVHGIWGEPVQAMEKKAFIANACVYVCLLTLNSKIVFLLNDITYIHMHIKYVITGQSVADCERRYVWSRAFSNIEFPLKVYGATNYHFISVSCKTIVTSLETIRGAMLFTGNRENLQIV